MRTSPAPWQVTEVLITDSDGDTLIQPRWKERWAPEITLGDEWTYLAERVSSGAGGNLLSYELVGFDALTYSAVEQAVHLLAAALAESHFGPFGPGHVLSGDPLAEPISAARPPQTDPHLKLPKP